MFSQITLKSKLLVSFFLVTSISAAITTLFSIRYFSEKIHTEAVENMGKNIQVAQLIYNRTVSEVQNFARDIANDIVLQRFITLDLPEKVTEYLTEKILQGKYYITVFNTEGIPVTSKLGFPGQDDPSQSTLVKMLLASEKKHSIAAVERVTANSGAEMLLSISAASPIIKDEQFLGIVLIRFPLNHDMTIVSEIQKLLGVTAAIYHNETAISFTEQTSITSEIYQAVIQGRQNPYEVKDIRTGGQLAEYAALYDVNRLPVAVLGISVPADKYVKTQQQAVFTLVAIMLVCILGAYIIGYFLARSITVPIYHLLNGVKQVTSGDLSHEIRLVSRDELGTLTGAFNSMAKELRESFDNLDQKVKDATKELQATLARMTAIIDNMADGLLVTDLDGRISRANPALSEMFELRDDSIIRKHTGEIFDEDVVMLIENITTGIEEYSTSEIQLAHGRIGKAVATTITQHLSEAVADDQTSSAEKQECIGAVVLTRDITKEKEVDQMKTNFISTVSHELRTPLTSVLGFAKIIKKRFEKVLLPKFTDEEDKKTQRAVRQVNENLDIIISEGERLTALINDVLDIAKMEAGKIDWKMAPLSVTEIIERATVATSSLFAQKGLTLIKKVEENLPEIIGDRDRLIQVVINLISNAVKFTDDGAVTCQTTQEHQYITVKVIDTGIGIAEADRPRVFERFKQVGDTLTDKPKGTGLGLPICKEIVEHHGGTIWVESEPGKGSTFAFTLPIQPQSHTTNEGE